MRKFWTKEKLGKHTGLLSTIETIYKAYSKVSETDLFRKLNKSKFKLKNSDPVNWSSILIKSELDDCLDDKFIDAALDVNTTRPAIGKGEFLLVSLFKNIAFATGSGDLIDLETNDKIEMKGQNSKLSSGGSKYKSMSKGIMFYIYKMFNLVPSLDKFDLVFCQYIKTIIADNEDSMFKFFMLTQNTKKSYEEVADGAVKVYKEKKKLLRTVAAMHLYAYMHVENDDYLIATTSKYFRCFKCPNSIAEAYSILENFEVNDWRIGSSGISVSLK